MKVLKLLFLGLLWQLSDSSSTPSTPSNVTSEDSVFLRIASSLDAQSRLAAALNTLAELINPTKPNSALGKYFLLDDSIISELTNVDETHAARIIEELTDSNYNLTAFNEKSKRFKMFEKLHQLINTTVIPGKSEKDEVAAIIGGWDNFDKLDLNLLKFHQNALNSLEYSEDGDVARSRVRGAADSLAAIPTLLEAITDGIPKLDGRHRVMEIFGDFEYLVLSLKEYKDESQLKDDDVANLSKLFSKSQSYRTGNRVARMLKELAHASDFPKHMGIQLKHMLDGEPLRKVLNKGEDLKLLKTILNPFFEVEPVLLSIWKDLTDVTTEAFKEESGSVLRVLNLITSAGYSSESEFKTSWTHLNRVLKPEISISNDVTHFLVIFKNLTEAFDEYTQVLMMVKTLTESEEYKTAISGVEKIKDLETAVVINPVTPTSPKQGYSTHKVDRTPFDKARKSVVGVRIAFSVVLEKLQPINSTISNITEKINSFSSWKSDEVEKWLKQTSEHLRKSTDQTLLSRMSHVFQFVDSPPKSSSNFSDFTQVCSKLAASVKSATTKVEGLQTKLSNLKDDKYTKYLMEFNKYNVTQKFQSGFTLFKLFDQVIKGSAGFETFFKKGDLMEKEIRNLDYKDANRRGWMKKMKIFQSVKSKFFEMKAEILKRRGFYTPESIENLMSLRWLVENLADIPNPELVVSQWTDYAKEVKKSIPNNITAADGIFDLNFAAHQEKCSMAYANYKALLRFCKSILAAEKVSQLTFWDYNKNWIKIVGFIFVTILINAVIYAVTLISLERKAKQSQESEELEDFNEKWEEFEKRKRGQFMGTY
ncbi:hypothetical protein B9Z55_006272 [Caenorhabditis nigoni]|uniref:Domain of unknown function WSN domain-containing protein n=1 Tax=Caenorhabditis nigoni TaxID=1611254 RepID=A0A2G5V4G3_9PELO|nr:hypothetical protein B9Z55_006272 [Caenorhabditis nigoni]